MGSIIAYCGMICTDCAEFIATRADDLDALERIAARYREESRRPEIIPEQLLCDGCLTDSGRLSVLCAACEIRACGMTRGLVNCAHCPDYACERLRGFWRCRSEERKGYRAVLDEIKRGLTASS